MPKQNNLSSSKNTPGTTSVLNTSTKYNAATNSNQKFRSPNGVAASGDKRMSDATKKVGVAGAKFSASKGSPGDSSNNDP